MYCAEYDDVAYYRMAEAKDWCQISVCVSGA